MTRCPLRRYEDRVVDWVPICALTFFALAIRAKSRGELEIQRARALDGARMIRWCRANGWKRSQPVGQLEFSL